MQTNLTISFISFHFYFQIKNFLQNWPHLRPLCITIILIFALIKEKEGLVEINLCCNHHVNLAS